MMRHDIGQARAYGIVCVDCEQPPVGRIGKGPGLCREHLAAELDVALEASLTTGRVIDVRAVNPLVPSWAQL